MDELDPPVYPHPKLDNTLLTLHNWAYSLDLDLHEQSVLMAVILHVHWDTGQGVHGQR